MYKFEIKTTKPKEVIDLTDKINSLITKFQMKEGMCNIFVAHTTCALTTADLDPGTDEDLLEAIEKIFPSGNWRHPHDPTHVGEHIMSSLIGSSLLIPFDKGELILGSWQRIVLVELSGPRVRRYLS